MSNSIAPTATIMDGAIIGDHVVIEDHVHIDYGVIIRDHVHIKAGTTVDARCILGEHLMDFYADRINKRHPLVIGRNSIIRSEAIIYGDTVIGDHFQCGHRVTIREKTRIGHHTRIGTLSDIQGNCEIGNYVSIHSDVFVAPETVLRDYCWLFPHVVLTNDPTPPSETVKGVVVDEYAIVATGAIIMPGKHIGRDSLVGAGAVVTKDVPEQKVFVGNPAKEICDVGQIIDKTTGEPAYPWRFHFDRGMPWKDIGYDNWVIQTGQPGSNA